MKKSTTDESAKYAIVNKRVSNRNGNLVLLILKLVDVIQSKECCSCLLEGYQFVSMM